MKNKNKQGISLIVLVITIIVMIILAAAVVIALSNTGITGKANTAVKESNIAEVKHAATLAWAEAYLKHKDVTDETERIQKITDDVKNTLKDQGITEEKYKINVTEKGVTVIERGDITISLDKETITETISTGIPEEVTIVATINGIEEQLVWTSSNETVATVTSTGNIAKVTLLKEGTTTIKVASEGKEAVCTITVKEEVLEGQQINFEYVESSNLYEAGINNACKMTAGKTYVIVWDGTEYVCTARNIQYVTNDANPIKVTRNNAVGNAQIQKKVFGKAVTTTEADTGEPFIIGYSGGVAYLLTNSTASTHTVRIYEQGTN